jgi:hypothetical protein
MSDEMATFEGIEVTGETDKAIKCVINGLPCWVPKSLLSEDSEVYQSGTSGKLIVKQWWADKAGLT